MGENEDRGQKSAVGREQAAVNSHQCGNCRWWWPVEAAGGIPSEGDCRKSPPVPFYNAVCDSLGEPAPGTLQMWHAEVSRSFPKTKGYDWCGGWEHGIKGTPLSVSSKTTIEFPDAEKGSAIDDGRLTIDKEIERLGRMLTATRVEDKDRLAQIINRLSEIRYGAKPVEPVTRDFDALNVRYQNQSVFFNLVNYLKRIIRSSEYNQGDLHDAADFALFIVNEQLATERAIRHEETKGQINVFVDGKSHPARDGETVTGEQVKLVACVNLAMDLYHLEKKDGKTTPLRVFDDTAISLYDGIEFVTMPPAGSGN